MSNQTPAETIRLPGYDVFGELKEKHPPQRSTDASGPIGRTFRWDGQVWTVVAIGKMAGGKVYRAAPMLADGTLGKMRTFDPWKVALS